MTTASMIKRPMLPMMRANSWTCIIVKINAYITMSIMLINKAYLLDFSNVRKYPPIKEIVNKLESANDTLKLIYSEIDNRSV